MGWSSLGTQFCLELGFGVLVALAFVPKAPVGAFFYRIMGTTALVPILCATILPVAVGGVSASRPAVLAAGLAALCYPIYAGPFRGLRWALGLGIGIAGCATALVLQVGEAGVLASEVDWPRRVLASASALATGAVAGGVGLAMVLGHWYLTVPKLEVRHLTRLNRVTVAFMVLSAVLVGLTCLVFAEPLSRARTPIFSDFGLFYLGTRVVVGLVMPLLFAWMAAQSLRYSNTRSATGILYASTVLVLIGAAASIAMQDAYGVPL